MRYVFGDFWFFMEAALVAWVLGVWVGSKNELSFCLFSGVP
jgi:hypothetical protein